MLSKLADWCTLLYYRQAQTIKGFYERKLEQTNNLYMELSAVMLQLEQREREVARLVI